MTNQTKVTDPLVSLSSGRTLEDKLGDIINAADYGATVAGTAAANTTAINAAIAAAAGTGFVVVNPSVAYTEASLVMVDGVVVIIYGTAGTVIYLTKAHGSLPVVKGGIVVKSQGINGILLRSVDYGVSAEPMLQLVDIATGDIAAVETKWIEPIEISDPTAPAANRARLYIKDNGSGNTQLAVRFATGDVVSFVEQGQKTNLVGTATYDPGNLVDAAGVTTTVTVTGAVLGDLCLVSFSLDLQGITLTSYVSVADTVSVRFQNETGGAIDLGSGTLKALVIRNW